jgi:hypothetical protein
MRIPSAIFWTAVLAGCGAGAWLATPPVAAPARQAAQKAQSLAQFRFERNDGQFSSQAQLVARGPGYTLHLGPHEATFALRSAAARADVVRMQVLGASAQVSLEGEQPLAATANYLVGGPARWRSGVPLYRQARASRVYAGIDVLYYGRDGRLEYDFIVAPGADPRQIRLRFEGAQRPVVDDDGALHLAIGAHELLQPPPTIYQPDGNARDPVEGHYVVDASGAVAFEVAAYDATRPLVIDPVLVYSTLLGGAAEDAANAVAIDTQGNAYVAGNTNSPDLPATAGALNGGDEFNSDSDAFVAKFDPTGSELLYLTYLGGSLADIAHGIEVDAFGQAHVAGNTDGGFPTTPGTYGAGDGTCLGAFIVKLNSDGSAPLYSACLPGATANDLALGGDGTTYFGGDTVLIDGVPVLEADAYLARLSADGAELGYLKTFGGDSYDTVNTMAVDALGNLHAAGVTWDGDVDFVGTPGAYDETHAADDSLDAFVVKLDATGADFVYATLLGGGGVESANGLALGADGSVYVGGGTGSSDFPTTPGALRPAFEGGFEGYAAKIAPDGSSLLWSTRISTNTTVFDLALAPDALYTVGTNSMPPFPATPGAFNETHNGGRDVFLMVLSTDGARAVYATLIGGSYDDYVNDVEVDASGYAYLVGETPPSQEPFPTTPGAYDRTHGNPGFLDYDDAYLLKLEPIVDSVAQFTATAVNVAEGSISATVEVVRESNLAGTFHVDYTAVVRGTTEVLAEGTLTWADGASDTKQIQIPLVADGATTGSAAVVTLSLPNGRLGARRTATVTIGSGSGGGGALSLWFPLLAIAVAIIRLRPRTFARSARAWRPRGRAGP